MNDVVRLFSIIVLFWINTIVSYSICANPNPLTINQPDGSVISIVQKGDEYFHYITTTDGYRVVRNKKGVFEYAQLSASGVIISSGQKANNPQVRLSNEKQFVKTLPSANEFRNKLKSISNSKIPALSQKEFSFNKAAKVDGTFKLLIILANFSDTEISYSTADFDKMLNEENYNETGSFRDFYLENSNGKFEVVSTVIDWVTVPKTHDYYGASDQRNLEFVYEAVKAAYKNGVDFSQFDNDNDGVVDGIAVFHQGHGQESTADTTDIWSHAWGLSAGYSYRELNFGGTIVDDYSIQGELNGRSSDIASIGVICHEFGHVIGALDFYDTDYEENGQYDGTGYWDLMASGAYNGYNKTGDMPAHHNAYTKSQFGWIDVVELTNPGVVTVSPVIDSQVAYRVTTKNENEYFLIENRIKSGFDYELPGKGLIIYHVDSAYISEHENSNDVNAFEHRGMYIKVASGNLNSSSCPFPGSNNVTEFHDETTPSSLSWDEDETQKSITEIALEGDNIVFRFMDFQEGWPVDFNADIENDTSVILNWLLNDMGNDVLIAYSFDNTFGEPVNNHIYSEGDLLPDGGEIIYYGKDTTGLFHAVASTDDVHYYRIWSNKGDRYSNYREASIIHTNRVKLFVVDENNIPIDNVSVELNNKTGVTDSSGFVVFYDSFEDIELNIVECVNEGYEIFKRGFKTTDENRFVIKMQSDVLQSVNLNLDTVKFRNPVLSWNPIINEDFSNYTPFQLEIPNWTMLDLDGYATYDLSGIDFDNEQYVGSFMVFNGFDDSFISEGKVLNSYAGNQFLACISNYLGSNNDWLISPEIVPSSTTYLSFVARSLEAIQEGYGMDRIKVLVSEGGTEPSDFMKISEGTYIEVENKWTPYSFDLSEYAGKKIRFAIQCVSVNAVMLCIDRIIVSENQYLSSETNEIPLKINVERQPGLKSVEISGVKTTSVEEMKGGIIYEVYKNGSLYNTLEGFATNRFSDVGNICETNDYKVIARKNNLVESESQNVIIVDNCDIANNQSIVSFSESKKAFQFQLPDGVTSADFFIYDTNGRLINEGTTYGYMFYVSLEEFASGVFIIKLVHERGDEIIKVIN
ncbi:MAG: M6 family metalloprotease domain-containing protein [Marinilabiliaceae bacterium]|nr:M6 family metalloprotease domain-containing protein [Marinilabiliaceae bacterium]